MAAEKNRRDDKQTPSIDTDTESQLAIPIRSVLFQFKAARPAPRSHWRRRREVLRGIFQLDIPQFRGLAAIRTYTFRDEPFTACVMNQFSRQAVAIRVPFPRPDPPSQRIGIESEALFREAVFASRGIGPVKDAPQNTEAHEPL